MGLIAKNNGGGGDFKLVPQGTHLAVCNLVADLGLQQTEYKGEKKIKHQVLIRWEIPGERIEYEFEGESLEGPMVIGKTYTLSLNERANLRSDLEGWRGRAFTEEELGGFDLFNVLDKPCQITVTHTEKNGKTYANVASVVGWPKGLPTISAERGVIKYSDDDRLDWDKLPKWVREKIGAQKSEADIRALQDQHNSFGAHHGGGGETSDQGGDLDDEIPF